MPNGAKSSTGIGGISMSGLAEILLKEGFTISGSDNKESALTDQQQNRCPNTNRVVGRY